MFHGVMRRPREVFEYEMDDWLTRYTKRIRKNQIRFGDIMVVLEEGSGDLLHTAVSVGKDALWHKAGCDRHWRWEFISIDQCMEIYNEFWQVDVEWRRVVKKCSSFPKKHR